VEGIIAGVRRCRAPRCSGSRLDEGDAILRQGSMPRSRYFGRSRCWVRRAPLPEKPACRCDEALSAVCDVGIVSPLRSTKPSGASEGVPPLSVAAARSRRGPSPDGRGAGQPDKRSPTGDRRPRMCSPPPFLCTATGLHSESYARTRRRGDAAQFFAHEGGKSIGR
jgi:hypothetical protein